MALMPIVAGVDGSEESLRAVEWAALEAQRHRAPLRIVSVPALLRCMRAGAHAPDTVAAKLQDGSCRALDEAIARSRGSRASAAHRGQPARQPRRWRSPRAAPER